MKLAKQQRRQFYRAMRQVRLAVSKRSPRWLRRAVGPVVDYLDMLLVDHGIFRVIYPNRHRLGDQAWRASQPAPHQVAYYKRVGIKTIVNLRGPRDCGSYRLERRACQRHGIKLVDFQLKSRAAPAKDTIHEARTLLDDVEYPVLFHCKSGADRVGLMSTLYALFREREQAEQAIEQLDWKFGHFRAADTGVLDHFFDAYIADDAARPAKVNGAGETEYFLRWVDENYDPEQVASSFTAHGWSNVLVNRVLRRE